MHVGMVGLGNVGVLLAQNLQQAGYALTVHDLDQARAASLIEAGALWADTPATTAAVSDVFLTCLPSPDAVRAVMEGKNGAMPNLRSGATWIETSTTDVKEVKRLAGLAAKRGAATLEATLTLGVHRMKARTATVFAGGDEQVFGAHEELLRAMAGSVIYMGDLGTATVIKVITNLLAFINLLGSAEGLMLAKKAGVDLSRAHAAIAASYGGSYAHDTAMPVALSGTFDDGFGLGLALKDALLGLDLAEQHGLDLDLTKQMASIFEQVHEARGDEAFSTECVRHVEEKAGEKLRAAGFPTSMF